MRKLAAKRTPFYAGITSPKSLLPVDKSRDGDRLRRPRSDFMQFRCPTIV